MRFASVHCIGGCVIDRSGETAERQARLHTSNIGSLARSHGGAARNVAENLARLGVPVSLSTVVGRDEDGREVLAATEAAGVDVSRCRVIDGQRTATYTAIFGGDGELVIGLADMAIFAELDEGIVAAELAATRPDTLLFLDANLPERTLAALLSGRRGPASVGPVSVQKSLRIRDHLSLIDILFLNIHEAGALLAMPPDAAALAAALAASPVPRGVLTDGPKAPLPGPPGARNPSPLLRRSRQRQRGRRRARRRDDRAPVAGDDSSRPQSSGHARRPNPRGGRFRRRDRHHGGVLARRPAGPAAGFREDLR